MTDATAVLPREHRTLMRGGIVVLLVLLLLGFVSILWTPYPVTSVDVAAAMQDGSGAHWLGTDPLGRDVLSLVMKGILTSFAVSAVAVAVGALLGVPLGAAAAAWGGPADLALRGIGGFLASVPALVTAVLLAALFGSSAATLMVAIGIANVPAFAATTHDSLAAAQRLRYVEQAKLAGSGPWEILRRHTLLGIWRRILAQGLARLATGILAEAAFSYLGVGVQVPATSLGLLLHDAQAYALAKPGLLLAPGLTLFVIVLALNVTLRGIMPRERPDGAA